MTQKMIFMGAGEHSEAECKKLHAKLDDAIEWLGGMQQPGDPCEPCTPEEWHDAYVEEQNRGSQEIMQIIGDIASALGATVSRNDHEMNFVLEVGMKREQ